VIPPVSRSTFREMERGSRIVALILCLCLACCITRAQAQGFDATSLREPTNLAAGWLVHAGDDSAYAGTDFDDSR
jgi:sigma-B regulation protein RsbU (phosphoserine phosphatase)